MKTTHTKTTRRDFLSGMAGAAGVLIVPGLWRGRSAFGTEGVSPSKRGQDARDTERQRVEAAIPAKAFVQPRKPRRLLIFELNVGYGGHASIPTASLAFTLMGQKTGAFETVISKDPSMFEPKSLKEFDAVFLNNTVGNLFQEPRLRQSFVEFIYGGGGLLGVHGTSVAFTYWPGAREDWPEFGIMLGARGANHKTNDEHVFIKLEDLTHPVTAPFGGDFDYRDEFFRVHEPYSRNRVRVLLSIDTAKTDMQQSPSYGKVERADNDYALAWVRNYGRGRVFYCGFAHHPSVFWDPKMLQFYLAAVQFAMGDLPAPTTPSAKLTAAIRAQEKLGWQLTLVPSPLAELTLFETIDKAAELGLLYVGGSSRQKVSRDIPKDFDNQLNNDDMRQIRLKLDAAGVRLLVCRTDRSPSDDTDRDTMVKFAKRTGIEAVVLDKSGFIMNPDLNIERLNESVGNKEIAERLEEIHGYARKHVAFCLEFGRVRDAKSCAPIIELFNKTTMQLVSRGTS